MISTDLPTPRRALAVGAHPDDVEFGCAATLARWADDGCEVHLLVLTDGSKGSWDGDASRAELVATREREQRAAAEVLGATSVTFLGAVDGELSSDLATRARVCEVVRRTRPDVVLGHDPWKRYRIHPDHRHAGLVTLEGIVAARDPHFFPEQEHPAHRPRHVLLFEAEVVDHWERAEEHFDRRVRALLCHRSQWRTTMGITDERDRAAFVERQRATLATAGREAGLPLAEAFKLLDVS